ncbi:hypothetical protein JOB18_021974 [Solea senegalensis]|nr:hypothetical protein JOB18_021974 [Solea senegalensis]
MALVAALMPMETHNSEYGSFKRPRFLVERHLFDEIRGPSSVKHSPAKNPAKHGVYSNFQQRVQPQASDSGCRILFQRREGSAATLEKVGTTSCQAPIEENNRCNKINEQKIRIAS